ncbi:MAG: C40 family peptidase [Burkholderiales bacterium]
MNLRAALAALALAVPLATPCPAWADEVAPVPEPTSAPGYLDRARELVVQALSLIGVRYKFGGNSPDSGLDCSGFVNYVFRQAEGKQLPRDAVAMSKVGDKVDAPDLQPGDLVFFNTRRRPYSHVGIYVGEQRFIHAPSRGREVEVVDMTDRYWRTRYNGARRVSPP